MMPDGAPVTRALRDPKPVGVPPGDAGERLMLYRYDTVLPASHRSVGSRISEPHSGDYVHAAPESIVEAGDTSQVGEAAAREHAPQPGPGHVYDDEGSEQSAHGAVSVAPGRGWTGRLTVPITDAADIAFLLIQRHGDLPAGYSGEESADISIPAAEIDDVLALLVGLVAQARRHGVLASAATGAPAAGGNLAQRSG
jgi:hypothetical protein